MQTGSRPKTDWKTKKDTEKLAGGPQAGTLRICSPSSLKFLSRLITSSLSILLPREPSEAASEGRVGNYRRPLPSMPFNWPRCP